jgi:lysophospholipase L1-like esterase
MTDSGTTDSGTTDSGTTDSGTTDSGNTEIELSCSAVTVEDLINTGGSVNLTLPADLTQTASQLILQTDISNLMTQFDPTSGAITLVPGASRLPIDIDYTVESTDNSVIGNYRHTLLINPLRIMPLGDSITQGIEYFETTDLPPPPMRVGYRKFLYDRLTNDGFEIDFLGQGGQSAGEAAGLLDPENNGYPGVEVSFLVAKLEEQLAEDPVDVILLHIGTNNTPSDAAGIDEWLDGLDTWEAANYPVQVFIATIVPKRDPALNAVVDQFNADLRTRIAARAGDMVQLVEQNLAVSVNEISDEPIGIHPNIDGYELMANAWYEALIGSAALRQCDQ